MTITGIITAIVVGAIIGALARLILPGRQNIPIWLTIVVGIVAAFIGTFLARAIGIPTATSGIDWLELLVQLVVAVIGVALAVGIYSRRGVQPGRPALTPAAGPEPGRGPGRRRWHLLDAAVIFGDRTISG